MFKLQDYKTSLLQRGLGWAFNMKIVIMDGHAANPGDLSWDAFREFGEVVVYERSKPEEVVERAKDADIVFTNKVVFNDENMALLPNLKYIGILATGTNVVDLDAAHRRGIVVTNIPAYSTDSVAQLVFAHILNIVNRTDVYANDVRRGRWAQNPDFCYWDSQIHELASMSLGIVGMGNIGSKVAQIALAFGMKVNVCSSKDISKLPQGVEKQTLDELFASNDIISLHCPLTPSTKNIINRESIAKMKPSAIVVNTGRGPLVDEADMAEALKGGRIAAYATDVMCQEPPQADNPLFGCENAFITPHLAWGSIEARERLMDIALENVRQFVNNTPINQV